MKKLFISLLTRIFYRKVECSVMDGLNYRIVPVHLQKCNFLGINREERIKLNEVAISHTCEPPWILPTHHSWMVAVMAESACLTTKMMELEYQEKCKKIHLYNNGAERVYPIVNS